MSAELHFAGWYQCRLATDPDAFDAPRGSAGWTFALGDEPDLDRVIRFQDPVAPRSHAPPVGVSVRAVAINGQAPGAHPLVGARVELAERAVYEGRNGEIAPSAQEPIVPFHLVVTGAGGVRLDAFDPMDLTNLEEVGRRQPVGFTSNSAAALQAAGIGTPAAYRVQRAEAVTAELAAETDLTRRGALQKRLDELNAGGIRRTSLAFQLDYDFALRGPNVLTDPGGTLGLAQPAPGSWRVSFWMGAWDADGLCGFVNGRLSLS